MSIKTRENLNAVSDEQLRRRELALATVDRIIKETPAQISVEMYARNIAFEAYAAGWNNKAAEIGEAEDAD